MRRYERIVLHIPHAGVVGLDGARWADREALQCHVDYLTDWRTDTLFTRPDTPEIVPVVADRSRFVVDCERLVDDPMEVFGQGIVYTRYNGNTRKVGTLERLSLMRYYRRHVGRLRRALTPDSILIDCHSFPSDKADIDICIGFNEDWSRPDDGTLRAVADTFKANGYSVAFNHPYANSVAPPTGFVYPSLMIEANKRCYWDELGLRFNDGADRLYSTISQTYKTLLK